MSTTRNLKLTRFVKVLLDIIFWVLVFASAFLVLWIMISPIVLKMTDIVITSSVPVAIGLGDEPQLAVEVAGAEAKGVQAAYVEGAQGTLRLETSNWSMILISNLAKLISAIGLAYVVYLLRTVLQSILEGDPFAPVNTVLIRRIGYMVLLVGFLKAAVEYFAAWEILNQLKVVAPPLSLPSPFEAELILASLLILVLAQVWSYGLDLEREKALTI